MSGLAAILDGVGAVAGALSGLSPLVEQIRATTKAKNAQVTEELTRQLTQVKENLGHVGELGRAAEDYSQALESVLELLWLCERVRSVLQDSHAEVNDPTSARHAVTWAVVTSLWDLIDKGNDLVRQGTRGLKHWYDDKDDLTMQGYLHDFDTARTAGKVYVRSRAPVELERELDVMIEQLRRAESNIRATLYDKILRALQTLG